MLLLERAGEVLLERRAPTGIWGGLWSLPELALDEDVAAACRARFGRGRAGRHRRPGVALPPIEHGFTHYRLTLHPLRVRVRRVAPGAREDGVLWLAPGDAVEAALPAPIRALLRSRIG